MQDLEELVNAVEVPIKSAPVVIRVPNDTAYWFPDFSRYRATWWVVVLVALILAIICYVSFLSEAESQQEILDRRIEQQCVDIMKQRESIRYQFESIGESLGKDLTPLFDTQLQPDYDCTP